MTTTPRTRKATKGLTSAPPEPSGDLQERIRAAALSLFTRKGYANVSIREICSLANASLPMVYYYYGDKRGLYRAVLEESLKRRRTVLDEAASRKGDPITRLRAVVEAWAGINEEPAMQELRYFFLRGLLSLDVDSYTHSVENGDRRFRHTLKAILTDGIKQGVFKPVRVEMTVLAITGIVNTFARRIAQGAKLPMQEGVEQVMSTFLFGLAEQQPAVVDAGATIAAEDGRAEAPAGVSPLVPLPAKNGGTARRPRKATAGA